MTASQKLAVRLSEVRQRLNEIGGLEGDAYLEEVRAEETKLQTEYRDTEQRWRSATIAEGDAAAAAGAQFGTRGSVEDRAYRELVGRADVGDVFAAVMEHRATDGAMRELQEHHRLNGNQLPLDCLRAPVEEHRALTAAPTNVGTSEQPVILPVFAGGDAAYLGVDQPSVPVGDAVFPVLETRPTVGVHADDTAVGETTGTFAAELLTPSRAQASFQYKRTDAARFRGMGDALRAALNEGLSEALDKELATGTEGLFTGTKLSNNAAAAITTFADYVSDFAHGRVDGRFARRASDLRVLVGSDTYAHMGSVYRATESQESALERIMSVVGDLRVSANVPDVASHKQNAVVRLGMRRDAVQPIWEGVTILVSEAEMALAKKGQIFVTAVLLQATKILRAGGFYKRETKHA